MKRKLIATRNIMHQLNVRSQAAHPKDVTTPQMGRATVRVKQMAKSSLKNEKHEKSPRRLSHLNRGKEEREGIGSNRRKI